MQTILGAGGAIGKELALELKKYSGHIRLVARNPRSVNPDDELFPADLLNADQVNRAVEGSEIAYLTVGLKYSSGVWREQWPILMENVIAACKRQGTKLVFFDNVYTYDRDYLNPMTEDTPVRPTSRKGRVRYEVVKMLLEEMKQERLNALIARSADFIAPANSVVMETVWKNLEAGRKAMLMGKPDRLHNFTTSPDAARGTALLGNTPEAYGQVWHLPTHNPPLTWQQWVELFAREMGTEPRMRVLQGWVLGVAGIFMPLMREIGEMNYQNKRDYVFVSRKFESAFNYTPMTPEEGVKWVLGEMETSSAGKV